MKRILPTFFALLTLASCVKIPVQSVELADALITEGDRMHRINLAFVNNIFNTKKAEVERFVQQQYVPAIVRSFTSLLPANTDVNKDLPNMMMALQPEIDKRRDSLVNGLEQQKEKLVARLNTDYKAFENAALTLKQLLESAAKIDKEKAALFATVKDVSKNRLDFALLEKSLDNYVQAAGTAGNKISSLEQSLQPFFSTNK